MTLSDLCRPVAAAFADEDGGAPGLLDAVTVEGGGALASWFAVTDLAVATIGMAGLSLARLSAGTQGALPRVAVDRRRASIWFSRTIQPIGWRTPDIWDEIAGDYRAADGWIRLHTNAPHHRAAVLAVLGCAADRPSVGTAVSGWEAGALERAVVAAGGCAAEMRGLEQWSRHEQGRAVAGEPLVAWLVHETVAPDPRRHDATRPLAGVRVLDLTRILAGPVAGRFLAGYGADVLRIDPPGWDEPAVAPEVTLGKRCAELDLRDPSGRARFERLLSEADVLLHGYRPGALEGLGYGPAERREINPAQIDVSLSAYGWTGPWAGRRGYDSLVQMSSGIAAYGMAREAAERPVPLPAQALDHGTGYLMAAAVLHGLGMRRQRGRVLSARLSLARTARLFSSTAGREKVGEAIELGETDLAAGVEETAWGPARRACPPLRIDGIEAVWPHPAGRLRSAPAQWRG